jgi:hypothetical protein
MNTVTLNNIFQVASESLSKAAKRRKRKKLKKKKENMTNKPNNRSNPFGLAKGTHNISGQSKHRDKTKYRRKNKYNKIHEGKYSLHDKLKEFVKLGV